MMMHGLISYCEFAGFGGHYRSALSSLLSNVISKGADTFQKEYQTQRWEDMANGIYRWLGSELGQKLPYVELHSKNAKDAAKAQKLIGDLSSKLGTPDSKTLWRMMPQGKYMIVGGRFIEHVITDKKGTIGHKAYALMALAEWINIGQRAFLINLVENDLTTRVMAPSDTKTVYAGGGDPNLSKDFVPRSLVMIDEIKAIPMLTRKMSKLRLVPKNIKVITSGVQGIRNMDTESGVILMDCTDTWKGAYEALKNSYPKLALNNPSAVPQTVTKISRTLRLFG